MLGKDFNTPSNSEWRPVMSPYGGLDTSSPYDYDRVEIRRGQDGEVSAVDFRKLSPTFNVAGLYWRPIRVNGK